METTSLKLKQASAVLKVHPKDLQNLVQFGVVKPKRAKGTYLFDAKALLTAKVAFCLKESLGTGTNVLVRLIKAFHASEKQIRATNPEYVVFTCRFAQGDEPVRLGVPLRSLEEQIQNDMGRVALYRDLPRGRKRPGWKREFLATLSDAAKDMGNVSEKEILQTIGEHRQERRLRPEIAVTAES